MITLQSQTSINFEKLNICDIGEDEKARLYVINKIIMLGKKKKYFRS